jgi:ribonuclease P protein component
MREEDVPAEQPEAQEEARLPGAYALARRPGVVGAPPGEGPPPPVRLIWRVRDRATFRQLATATRCRRGPVMIAAVPTAAGPPRVAYAVGRAVGNAVTRNRVRRRLREAVRAEGERLQAGHAYLVGARPGIHRLTQREITDAVRAILADLRRGAMP